MGGLAVAGVSRVDGARPPQLPRSMSARSAIPDLIGRVVASSIRRAWVTIAVWTVLAALALSHVVTHFAIDTDVSKLISPDLPWRQREAALDRAFPQRTDLIAVVIDGAM